MGNRIPGPMCSSKLGPDWIDDGTMCRSRSSAPGVTGLQGRPDRHRKTGPAIAVKNFSASGPNPQLGKGLASMLITDLVGIQGAYQCKPIVVEWERRADLEREIELSNSAGFDPATRIPRGHLIAPDVFVTGSVVTTEANTSWSIEIVEIKTGERIGVDSGRANGEAILDASPGIAKRLLDHISIWWSKKTREDMIHSHP